MIKRLSNKEVKEISLEISDIDKKDIVDVIDDKFLKINNEIKYFRFQNKWIPTLKYIYSEKSCNLKKVIVDMGAIKFVTNGADVMRPGIRNFDEGIQQNEIIQIQEETHGKTIALGQAMGTTEEMKKQEKGKIIKNIHYVGDSIWNI
jgi:PUA domain protein